MPELIYNRPIRLLEQWNIAHGDTTHTFSNLNGNADIFYILSGRVETHSTTGRNIFARPNGASSQFAAAGHSGGSDGHGGWNSGYTGWRVCYGGAQPIIAIFEAIIYAKAVAGQKRMFQSNSSLWSYPANNYNQNVHEGGEWQNDAQANITSLVFLIDGDHFNSGVVRLYKLV